MPPLTQYCKKFLLTHKILHPNQPARFLLLLSGGADSVCLLETFCLLRNAEKKNAIQLFALHVNYEKRGEESKRDENFLKILCRNKKVPLSIEYPNTISPKSKNLQNEARKFRYAVAEKLATQKNCSFYFTAHHQSDRLETFFLKLFSAASPKALIGMKLKTGKLFRPFFFVPKKKLQQFFQQNQLHYVQDSSNFLSKYHRNTFRNTITPAISQSFPHWKNHVAKTMDLLQQQQEILHFLLTTSSLAALEKNFVILNNRFFSLPTNKKQFLIHFLLLAAYPHKRFSHQELLAINQKLDQGLTGKILFDLPTPPKSTTPIFYSCGLVGPLFQENQTLLTFNKKKIFLNEKKNIPAPTCFFSTQKTSSPPKPEKNTIIIPFPSPAPLTQIAWVSFQSVKIEKYFHSKHIKKQLQKLPYPKQIRNIGFCILVPQPPQKNTPITPPPKLLAFIFSPMTNHYTEFITIKKWLKLRNRNPIATPQTIIHPFFPKTNQTTLYQIYFKLA